MGTMPVPLLMLVLAWVFIVAAFYLLTGHSRRRQRALLARARASVRPTLLGAPPAAPCSALPLPVLPLRLRAPPARESAKILCPAVLCAALLWSLPPNPAFVVGALIVFLALLVAATKLLPYNAYLTLTTEGFEYSSIFRRRFVSWYWVQSFEEEREQGLGPMTARLCVGWKLVCGLPPPRPTASISAPRMSLDGRLPSRYELAQEQLCDLLNGLCERYGRPTAAFSDAPVSAARSGEAAR